MATKKTPEKVNEEGATTAAGATLHTKSVMMSGVLAAMASMSNEEMMKWFPDAMELASTVGNPAAKNAASIAMKPSNASPVQEDVAALFEGNDLSEDTKTKINTLIEHAVDLQLTIYKEQLAEEHQTKLVEEVARVQEDLVGKVDNYVTYAAEQWVEKNQVAIESVVKVERATRLIEGLKSLLSECGVEITEEQTGVVESLETQLAETKAKLNEAVEEIVALREEITAANALAIFKEVSEGLTAVEADKFKKLVEDIDVSIDPAALRSKITIIKEAHFRKKSDTSESLAKSMTEGSDVVVDTKTTEALTEGAEDKKPIEDPVMARYVDAISRGSNRYSRGPFSS